MKTVLVFGAFDPLHAGHRDLFRQARALGDRLIVVVTRDAAILKQKQREPHQSELVRTQAVAAEAAVTEAIVGQEPPHQYELLRELTFDVIALGYDQAPTDDAVRALLRSIGKERVEVVRLAPHYPEKYKSSKLRKIG